mmetsp:Transcript_56212/g.119668  ORF Transcript_56212/g.119668 Transcript_56212/m.119668 type:complete len:229 (-) Transcript_56212:6-692(-)
MRWAPLAPVVLGLNSLVLARTGCKSSSTPRSDSTTYADLCVGFPSHRPRRSCYGASNFVEVHLRRTLRSFSNCKYSSFESLGAQILILASLGDNDFVSAWTFRIYSCRTLRSSFFRPIASLVSNFVEFGFALANLVVVDGLSSRTSLQSCYFCSSLGLSFCEHLPDFAYLFKFGVEHLHDIRKQAPTAGCLDDGGHWSWWKSATRSLHLERSRLQECHQNSFWKEATR